MQDVGSEVRNFKRGDHVVCPFTISWWVTLSIGSVCVSYGSSECFYCKEGHTSRCAQSKLLGSAVLDGAQAEYVCMIHCRMDCSERDRFGFL